MKTARNRARTVFVLALFLASNVQSQEGATQLRASSVDNAGTVRVPAYDLPLSIYMSEEAKRFFIIESHRRSPSLPMDDAAKMRDIADRIVLRPKLEKMKAAFEVVVEEQRIAGVKTYVVTPKGGVAGPNRDRVLINVHGGGFMIGTGSLQLIESIPIAATTGIKVVSVDYRLAPEHPFPASRDDVASVYKALLAQYPAQNIGMYGHSVGGALVTMAVAWFQHEKLPLPGAIGILSPSGAISGGDSRYVAASTTPTRGESVVVPPPFPNPPPLSDYYFAGVNIKDPSVSPALHPKVLAKFPPALLITGTRDYLESSAVNMHRELVKAGVEAQLHVWDGMWHSFMFEVDLPEAREVYAVTAKFFDRHLAPSQFEK